MPATNSYGDKGMFLKAGSSLARRKKIGSGSGSICPIANWNQAMQYWQIEKV
jgi:hypothetical protein